MSYIIHIYTKQTKIFLLVANFGNYSKVMHYIFFGKWKFLALRLKTFLYFLKHIRETYL